MFWGLVMEFIPAIDLIEGQCVRLVRGDFSKQISYGNPLDAAFEIEEQGPTWLHLVDLDAARSHDRVKNRKVIEDICNHSKMNIEVGGGIRSVEDARLLFDLGVRRVILGTMAIENPQLIADLADINSSGVAVGLDYRFKDGQYQVSLRGWLEDSGVDLFDVLPALVELGAAAVVATDISRDGTFDGPDLKTLERILHVENCGDFELIASGGVSDLDDIMKLKSLEVGGKSVFGVISGRAVHDGRIDVREAVKLCRA